MAPRNRAEYRDVLASEFLHVLKEKGLQWKKGWSGSAPMNAVTKSQYHGINRFCLSMIALDRGYNDPRWATMVQIMDRRGLYHPKEKWHLQAGAKAVYVEYWYPYDTQLHRALRWEVFRKLPVEERSSSRYILRASYTPVFHASQIDGISDWEPESRPEQKLDSLINTLSQNMGVMIAHDGGDRAFYRPSEDMIHLPKPEAFQNEYELNATALHELSHATGHSSRLARACSTTFGTPKYAYEELIAEISSCFMSITLHVEQAPEHIQNHKAYVQSWIQIIQDQPETLIRAVKEAQRAANYMDYQAELISEEEYTAVCSDAVTVPAVAVREGKAMVVEREVAASKFEQQVDAALSHEGDFSGNQITLSKTPDYFKKYGFNSELPLVVRSRKIREMHEPPRSTGANRHGLGIDIIKNLPELVAAPAIVMISRTHPSDSIVVVTDMEDTLNRPVILAIQANNRANVNRLNIMVNSLNSAYGRDEFDSFLQRAYEENLILSVGEKNSHRLLQSPWLQLPSGLQYGDYTVNIARFYEAVNKCDNRFTTAAKQMARTAESEDELEL